MDKVAKNRWQVRIAAMIIFVLGFAAGIAALNVYRGVVRGGGGPRDRFEQMAERLNLNADQKTKVQQILGDTREQLRALHRESEPRVNEIRGQADARLQEVLTPEQWQKFQTMRSEMRGRRGGRGPRIDGGPRDERP
ncbi:MAG TPA: periplasmic heavy metal sensor [Pyrinomonadaceae bacterium]|nr:periplasmic heavy metal sensor [Pyrinomonadaceae bacterium]